jgi:hypothetical protein
LLEREQDVAAIIEEAATRVFVLCDGTQDLDRTPIYGK